jgi:beta-aspartyl-peptidase (threonine type)
MTIRNIANPRRFLHYAFSDVYFRCLAALFVCGASVGELYSLHHSLRGVMKYSSASPAAADSAFGNKIAIAIHGGAGTIRRSAMTAEAEAAYRAALTEALQAGYAVLKSGGTSLDAVSAAVVVLEDSPLFNAGKGAVLTADGATELDAAIMDGATLRAGAVAGVRGVKNPIRLARRVMDSSEHVLLVGAGAEDFAAREGFERMPPEYFLTERRRQELERLRRESDDAQGGAKGSPRSPDETPSENINGGGDSKNPSKNDVKPIKKSRPKTQKIGRASAREGAPVRKAESAATTTQAPLEEKKYGTVGAVALDSYGNLAAATSTGGMTNKRYGRVGDAPIIGAGTYASNSSCAVSATGHGEYFIRSVVAYDIAAQMEYKRLSLKDAANETVMKKLVERGGSGGVIAIDAQGNIAMPFNSEGMYRGYIDTAGNLRVEIFRSEEK